LLYQAKVGLHSEIRFPTSLFNSSDIMLGAAILLFGLRLRPFIFLRSDSFRIGFWARFRL